MPPTVLANFPAKIKVTLGPDFQGLPATMVLSQIPGSSVEDALLRYSEDGTNVASATNRLSVEWNSYLDRYASYTSATMSGAGNYFSLVAKVFHYYTAYPSYTTWNFMPIVWNMYQKSAGQFYTFLNWFSGSGANFHRRRDGQKARNSAYWTPQTLVPYGTYNYSRDNNYSFSGSWQLNDHLFLTMEEFIEPAIGPDKTSYHFG